jgi:O-antigen ligase
MIYMGKKVIIIFFIFASLVLGNGAIPKVIAKVLLVLTVVPYLFPKSKTTTILKPYILWCVAFVALCWMSLLWAHDKDTGKFFVTTVTFVYVCNIVMAALIINQDKPINYWLKIFMYSTLFMSVVFLLQHGISYGEDISRGDTDINMNTIGMVSGISCSLAVYFYKFDKDLKGKFYLLILAGAFIFIVLLTASRKALMVPLIVYSIFKVLSGNASRFILNIIAITVIVSFSLWAVLNVPILYEMMGYRMEGMINGFFGDEEDMDGSTYTRIKLTEFGMMVYYLRPILGYGVCNFRAVYTSYFPGRNSLYAHNNYIELLVDFGTVGIVLYYIFYLYLIVKLYKIARSSNDHTALILLAVVVSLVFVQYGFVAYYSLFNNILLTFAACYVLLNKYKSSRNLWAQIRKNY